MEFEWDEDKRQSIISTREVDILKAARIFEGEVVTQVDTRRDYGERRLISLGLVGDEAFVVVHTDRAGATRLITAWKGGRSAKRKYQASLAGRHSANG